MAAVVAGLDPELAGPASIPEPVSGPIGGRSGSNRAFPGGVVFRSLPTGTRPELENPECHRADPVPGVVGVDLGGRRIIKKNNTPPLLLLAPDQCPRSGPDTHRPKEPVVGLGRLAPAPACCSPVSPASASSAPRYSLYSTSPSPPPRALAMCRAPPGPTLKARAFGGCTPGPVDRKPPPPDILGLIRHLVLDIRSDIRGYPNGYPRGHGGYAQSLFASRPDIRGYPNGYP